MPPRSTIPLTRRAFGIGGAALAAVAGTGRAKVAPRIRTGLDRLVAGEWARAQGQRVALLTHAGAVDAQGRRSVDAVAAALGPGLVALLSPEHGLSGAAAAGEAVADGVDQATGLPVHSLYGAHQAPPAELWGQIDTLLIDLQDIGLRPFTYAGTMRAVLAAAAEAGKAVVVLDRPNPLGGMRIDGPLLDPALASSVGAIPVPFCHGLTIGEIALLLRQTDRLDLDLMVLQMQGWRRRMGSAVFARGALPFVPPSPNLRSQQAILAYAASVLIEGTDLSEGRGTDHPFETLGAPWCDGAALARALSALDLPGVSFAALHFTPSASKHAGLHCGGVRFEVRDERAFDPLLTGLSLIAAVQRIHPADFAFLAGPRPFFDLLTGQAWIREALIAGDAPAAIVRRWQGDVAEFSAERRQFLRYPV